MPLIAAHTISTPAGGSQQVYNALDCCLTWEILSAIQPLARDPNTSLLYDFERALQAPVLEMSLRGFRVDPGQRELGIAATKESLARLDFIIQTLARAIWDKGLNPNSGPQLRDFFYSCLRIPPITVSKKGEVKTPMDREVLERLEAYFQARPVVNAILAYRDLAKQLQVLETEVDPDWRMRTSYNIAGTTTGRFSSSKSSTGSGTNLQNISPDLRRMFVADPGMLLYGIDLEQAESREVGWLCGILFGDWSYLDACEGGDLHTIVARMVWPEMAWTGDTKHDRGVAEQIFYREFSYRDACKRLGHGCLTEDHEVLTPGGWAPITSKPPVILQWEPYGDGPLATRMVRVDGWVDKAWTGEFHQWSHPHLSIHMTADHRVYSINPRTGLPEVHTPLSTPGSGRIPLGDGRLVAVSSIQKHTTYGTRRVLCPTVPSGAFFIRHNGKISITGNSNYYGKPPTLSMHTKIPVKLCAGFQERYFSAFPGIPRLHQWVARELQTTARLTNVFGRARDFFDRPNSDETLRAAIAFLPQSATADRLNLGMWRIWRHMPEVQLLAQVHDAVYFQAPEALDRHEVAAKALSLLDVQLRHGSRVFTVPGEAKTGWNWGNRWKTDSEGNKVEVNPRGLDKISAQR